ncbi:MAG: hypothetical protein ACK5WZ_07695 [Pseudobdellovibrionaceae bacterium]
MNKKVFMVFLALCCCVVGYGFYKINQRDIVSGVFMTIGLLGIILSVMRENKKPE